MHTLRSVTVPSKAFMESLWAWVPCLGLAFLLSAFALAAPSWCLPFRLGRPFGVDRGLLGE